MYIYICVFLLHAKYGHSLLGFPGGSDRKASARNAGDPGLTPGSGRSLEKEMATHSSIFAWRIPWTEEPGGLQSMGSQRVGHDWVTSLPKMLKMSHLIISDSSGFHPQIRSKFGWGSLYTIPQVQLLEFFQIWKAVSIREKLSSYICSIQWYSWHRITAANSSKKPHRKHTAVTTAL